MEQKGIVFHSSAVQISAQENKLAKDGQIQSSVASSPLQSFNFSAHNLNILVQHYDAQSSQQQEQGRALSQILEDMSENTLQSQQSYPNNFPSSSPSVLNGSREDNIEYDQQMGAERRGKLFELQEMLNFRKHKNELDDALNITEEIQEQKSLTGNLPEHQSRKPSNTNKWNKTIQSKTLKSHNVVTIRSPDVIWRQKLFFIVAAISRMVLKMKRVNIFRHPEQLYQTQLNAINDKAAKDCSEQDWGQQECKDQRQLLIKAAANAASRNNQPPIIKQLKLKFRILQRKLRKQFKPLTKVLHSLKQEVGRTLLSFSKRVTTFDSMSYCIAIWSHSIFFLTLALFFFIPFSYSFENDKKSVSLALNIVINVILPIIFFTNILVNANTSFFERGNVIYDHFLVFLHYGKTGLVLDLISAIALLFSTDSWPIFLFFCRALLYYDFFSKQTERYLMIHQTTLLLVNFFRLLVWALFICHCLTCIYFKLEIHLANNFQKGWLFSTSTTTLTAETNQEKVFLSFLGLFGMFLISYLMHGVQRMLKAGDDKQEEYQKQLKSLTIYMSSHEVDPYLRERSRKYLEFMYSGEQERAWSTDDNLRVLSTYLREEIIKDVFTKAAKKVSTFNKFFKDSTFLEKLALRSKELALGPEELVIRQGSIGIPSIYFITHGEIQLFVKTGSLANTQIKVFKTIGTSECFGGFEFFSANYSAQISAKSLGVSRLLRVSLTDMHELLREFPKEREAYCFLKDSVGLKQDFSSIDLTCYSCRQSGHYILECPYLFYGTQPQKVLKEINKSIKNTIKTFKRSYYRKKLKSVSSYPILRAKVSLLQDAYAKQIEELYEDDDLEMWGQGNDDDDDDDDDEDDDDDAQNSSYTSVKFHNNSYTSSLQDFDGPNLNQSRLEKDRKSILRKHSGSSKFTARQHRYKDNESQKSLLNSRLDLSSRDDREGTIGRGKSHNINISKFGRLIKISDLNIGPSEDSAFSSMKERRISLSNNYDLNTVGRINSGEFYNNDEAKRMLSLFRQSDSDKHLSYENILDSYDGSEYFGISDMASIRKSQKRHSSYKTNMSNKTSRTNKTSQTAIIKTNQQIDMEERSFKKSRTVDPDKIRIIPDISPISFPKRDSGNNSVSSNLAIQLHNPSNNSNIVNGNLASSQMNNLQPSFLNNGNSQLQQISLLNSSLINNQQLVINQQNNLNSSFNIATMSAIPVQKQQVSILSKQQSLNNLQPQRSGSASLSQKFNSHQNGAQNFEPKGINLSRRSQYVTDNFQGINWSLGTVKSFEIYFPQNNIENILQKYNKLQRKKLPRRVKNKRITLKRETLKRETVKLLEPKQLMPEIYETQHLVSQVIGTEKENMPLASDRCFLQSTPKNNAQLDIFSIASFNLNESPQTKLIGQQSKQRF